MPIEKTALKAVRKDARRRLRNLRLSSELRTLAKKFEQLLSQRQMAEAKTQLAHLMQRIDQAKTKGVLHPNAAARKKSRLARRLAASPT